MGYLEIVTKDSVYDFDFCVKTCNEGKAKKKRENCVCAYYLSDRIRIQKALAYLEAHNIPLTLAIPREELEERERVFWCKNYSPICIEKGSCDNCIVKKSGLRNL